MCACQTRDISLSTRDHTRPFDLTDQSEFEHACMLVNILVNYR